MWNRNLKIFLQISSLDTHCNYLARLVHDVFVIILCFLVASPLSTPAARKILETADDHDTVEVTVISWKWVLITFSSLRVFACLFSWCPPCHLKKCTGMCIHVFSVKIRAVNELCCGATTYKPSAAEFLLQNECYAQHIQWRKENTSWAIDPMISSALNYTFFAFIVLQFYQKKTCWPF